MAVSHLAIQMQVILHIRHHCQEALPEEGCGILAGSDCAITHFFPIPNQDASPRSFSFEPRAYLEAIRRMRNEGLTWLGIVHSHPQTDPIPSARDISQWHYPDLTHWILSLKEKEPRLSAYRIQNGRVTPVIYQVLAGQHGTYR